MENIKTSISFNLSNQANTYKIRRTCLYQFNCIMLLGLDFKEKSIRFKEIPVSVRMDKSGELSLSGLEGDMFNDAGIRIYTDKKVTESEIMES